MGGLGAGLRFKPMRYIGLRPIDFMGGHGYAGDQRNETALTFNALVFANPKDRAQVYFLAGFGWDWAHSTNDPSDPSQTSFDNHYTYFGGQIGLGLELRLSACSPSTSTCAASCARAPIRWRSSSPSSPTRRRARRPTRRAAPC